jgi:hypothetical protein
MIDNIENMTTYCEEKITIEVKANDNIEVKMVKWTGLGEIYEGTSWEGSFEISGNREIFISVMDTFSNVQSISFNIEVLPRDHDSDGDLVPDLIEIELGLFPYDPADGAWDIDSDGLFNTVEFKIGTDIDCHDSDSDGMPDGWEYGYGLDPNSPSGNTDTDGDGLTDLEEYISDSNPLIDDHGVEVKEDMVFSIWHIILGIIFLVIVVTSIIKYRKRGE